MCSLMYRTKLHKGWLIFVCLSNEVCISRNFITCPMTFRAIRGVIPCIQWPLMLLWIVASGEQTYLPQSARMHLGNEILYKHGELVLHIRFFVEEKYARQIIIILCFLNDRKWVNFSPALVSRAPGSIFTPRRDAEQPRYKCPEPTTALCA